MSISRFMKQIQVSRRSEILFQEELFVKWRCECVETQCLCGVVFTYRYHVTCYLFLATADTSVMNVVMVLVPSYMHMNTPFQCAISPTPKSSLLGNIHM